MSGVETQGMSCVERKVISFFEREDMSCVEREREREREKKCPVDRGRVLR